jgi:beta-glucosidase
MVAVSCMIMVVICSHAVKAQTATNLAFQKHDSASSMNGTTNIAARAVDGNVGTRWESAWVTDPSWIFVDLGDLYKVDSVFIRWENAAAVSYQIDVSDSNSAL